MSKVCMSSFGGSGENGRNCHCITVDDQIILLDCGVKREIIDGTVGFYPNLNEEVVKKISCVFLSHCHEDHVASLPLVYHYGYTGKVYATKETIAETVGFIKKWMTFVEKKNGVLPYTQEDVDKIQFEEISLGHQVVEGYDVTLGRTGHVLGASWYVFNFDGKKVLYTGDMVLQSASLQTDIPGQVDGAIMNGAYAGQSLNQQEQYNRLLQNVKDTWSNGGSVLLPIPPKGRGIDITVFLDEHLEEGTIYVEEAVITSMNALVKQTAWVKEGLSNQLSDKVVVVKNAEDRKEALQHQGIFITGDGMITTDVSAEYYEAVKGSSKNMILITGHAATGTIAAGVLNDVFRAENGVEAKADKIIFKVHLDDEDIEYMAEATGAKTLVLFHANPEHNVRITERLEKKNIVVTTLQYPNTIAI